jgi:peptidoglycan-N-acetylglucosamine deacetylase
MRYLAMGILMGLSGMMLSCTSKWTILRSGDSVELPDKTVVLTFDDGPNPRGEETERLLAVLNKYQVKASFCVIGKNVEQYPELVRLIFADGHDLVNHSQTHYLPLVKSRKRIRQEIKYCDEAIGAALDDGDYASLYFRPPYGMITQSFENQLGREGKQIVPVTFFIRDVYIGPEESEDYILKTLERLRKDKGGVVVIHEMRYRESPEAEKNYTSPRSGANRSWVPGAVDEMISVLSEEGYQFRSYSEVFGR